MNRLGPARTLEGALWRFVYLFAQAGLSLGAFIGLALLLPTDEFAPLTVALGVVVIAGALADLGLSSAAMTLLPARISQNPESREDLLSGAAKGFFWAAGIALALPLAALVGLDGPSQLDVLLIAPAAPAYVLVAGADSILRAEGEFRRPVFLVGVNRAGGLAALPIAATTTSGAWTCAAFACATVLATIPAYKVLASIRRAAPSAGASSVVRPALPIGASQLLMIFGGRVNTIILGSAVSTTSAAAFETSWRLFQTGQYFAGAVATGIAPFVGNALGEGRASELNRLLVRAIAIVLFVGLLVSVLLIVIMRPLAEVLVGELADDVSRTLLPLLIVGPLACMGFVGTIALTASDADRHVVLVAHAAGAVVNLVLAVLLVSRDGAPGAGVATAVGIGLTSAIILVRVVMLGKRMGRVLLAAADQPAPASDVYHPGGS